MSVSASIDLRIMDYVSQTIASPKKIIEILLKNEWNIQRSGHINYLPLGDCEGDFNWECQGISTESFMEILKQKELVNELIGVTTTWQDTYIGGEVLLWTKKEIDKDSFHINMSFSLTSDRKILADYGDFKITDVNWYLERLLPIFNQGDTSVEYFTYTEHR